jgi:hypothetical protein
MPKTEQWHYLYQKTSKVTGGAICTRIDPIKDPSSEPWVAFLQKIDNRKEQRRRGLLLAAAPQMLEALEALMGSSRPPEFNSDKFWNAIGMADAALAKARGVKLKSATRKR